MRYLRGVLGLRWLRFEGGNDNRVMGETGRLQDWKDCCYYYCSGRREEMEGVGSSQGLDLWVVAGGLVWAHTLWGGLTARGTQHRVFKSILLEGRTVCQI